MTSQLPPNSHALKTQKASGLSTHWLPVVRSALANYDILLQDFKCLSI